MKSLHHLCSLIVIALFLHSAARSQTCAPGELRVFVVDSQAGPVFDSQVRVSSLAAAPLERVTQSSGIADFAALPCGIWNVIAAKEGFEAAVKSIQVTSGANLEISLT